MRYLIPCVEQLDRAAEELRSANPVNSRLALILTDNVVELVCHRRCEEIINRDGGRSWLDQPKYRHGERRKVLGRHFDRKVKFLRTESLLSEAELEFLLVAHKYRNEAYHIGLRDDSIIWSVSWNYHLLACELFGRLKPGWMGTGSDDPYTERVNKHLKKQSAGEPWLFFPDIEKLAESIDQERPVSDVSLSEVLSEALIQEIDELDSQMQFLVNDNPNKFDSDEILRSVQQWDEFARKMEEAGLFPSDQGYQSQAAQVNERLKREWTPKHDHIPFESWRRRANAISLEKSPLKALKKFDDVRTSKEYLSEVIGEAALELDAHIQMEIDRIRGK